MGVVLRPFALPFSLSKLSKSSSISPDAGVCTDEEACEAGNEMGTEGTVESWPEVVYGVKSRISGKRTLHVFL